MSLSKDFAKLRISPINNYRYGPRAWREVDADGNPLKNKYCKVCSKACTFKDMIQSWRPDHLYHDAATYLAAVEMQEAHDHPEKKEALNKK